MVFKTVKRVEKKIVIREINTRLELSIKFIYISRNLEDESYQLPLQGHQSIAF